MNDGDCAFPDLPEHYDRALREAVAYVLERFEPLGILATGTIVRGDPGPTSDHDIQVLVPGNERLRIQKYFSGVPAEIFVNPPRQIPVYFENDRKANRPITAHMFATAFVVLDRDPEVERLRTLAREYLERGPEYGESELTWLRYAAALYLEDATDVAESDPEAAAFLASHAVMEMLRFAFFALKGVPVPRWKEILSSVDKLDPRAGQLARAFYREPEIAERLRLATALADHVISAHGFFEWESDPEDVE